MGCNALMHFYRFVRCDCGICVNVKLNENGWVGFVNSHSWFWVFLRRICICENSWLEFDTRWYWMIPGQYFFFSFIWEILLLHHIAWNWLMKVRLYWQQWPNYRNEFLMAPKIICEYRKGFYCHKLFCRTKSPMLPLVVMGLPWGWRSVARPCRA